MPIFECFDEPQGLLKYQTGKVAKNIMFKYSKADFSNTSFCALQMWHPFEIHGVGKVLLTSRGGFRSTRLSIPLLMAHSFINHINTDDCNFHHCRAHDCCINKTYRVKVLSVRSSCSMKCSLIQAHIEMESPKATKQDRKDFTTILHVPYILCHFSKHAACMFCLLHDASFYATVCLFLLCLNCV